MDCNLIPRTAYMLVASYFRPTLRCTFHTLQV